MSIDSIMGVTFISDNAEIEESYGKIEDNYGQSLYENDLIKQVNGKWNRAEAGDTWDSTFSGVRFTRSDGVTVSQKFWKANTRTLNAEDAKASGQRSSTGKCMIKANVEADANDRLDDDHMYETVDIIYPEEGDEVAGSSLVIDQSTKSTGSGQFRVLELAPIPGNEHGNGGVYICEPAEQKQKTTTGS